MQLELDAVALFQSVVREQCGAIGLFLRAVPPLAVAVKMPSLPPEQFNSVLSSVNSIGATVGISMEFTWQRFSFHWIYKRKYRLECNR